MAMILIPRIEKQVQTEGSMFKLMKTSVISLTKACFRPRFMAKPDDLHLPERVWRRHSALIMNMHDQNKH